MFPKNQRVPREIIKKVLFEGDKIQTELFLLRKKENLLLKNRFAVIVSKKVAKNAVTRHYLKRLYKNTIKEYFNEVETTGHDFVFVLKPKETNLSKDDIINTLSKINL
jgi:ribonuclease P protein component